jgi:hypothetical protein
MCGHQQMKLQHDLVLVLIITLSLSLSIPLSSWIRRSIYDSQGPGREREINRGRSIDYIHLTYTTTIRTRSCWQLHQLVVHHYIPSRLIQTEEGGRRRASYPRERKGREMERAGDR